MRAVCNPGAKTLKHGYNYIRSLDKRLVVLAQVTAGIRTHGHTLSFTA